MMVKSSDDFNAFLLWTDLTSFLLDGGGGFDQIAFNRGEVLDCLSHLFNKSIFK
jgi:hypothetical protein